MRPLLAQRRGISSVIGLKVEILINHLRSLKLNLQGNVDFLDRGAKRFHARLQQHPLDFGIANSVDKNGMQLLNDLRRRGDRSVDAVVAPHPHSSDAAKRYLV